MSSLLKKFEIKRDKGLSIKLKNKAVDVVIQFDDENKCNYWLFRKLENLSTNSIKKLSYDDLEY